MMDPEQINIVKNLAEPIVEQEDLFLVDAEIKGADETVVWVYVDSENKNVSVEACSKISRELGFVLDAHNVIETKYRLNVSSPGLSRSLSDLRQYRKNIGRVARIKFKSPDGYKKLEGKLKEVHNHSVVIEIEDDADRTVLLEEIVETKIIPKI